MKIGIIGAMEQEVKLLRSQMQDVVEEKAGPCTLYSGTLDGIPVHLVQSGIGKVNAAIAAVLLLKNQTVDCVINTGSAGGFSKELNIGDIVVSGTVVHNDVDVRAFGYAFGQVPGQPKVYTASAQLIQTAEKAIELSGMNHKTGLIASGDSFLHREDQIETLLKAFPDLLAGEMEAAAIAQTCSCFNIPFVVIRSISDVPGESENQLTFEEFLPLAAKNSGKVIHQMITLMKEEQ